MRKISNLFVEKYRESRQKEVADARGISVSELSVSGVTEVYANTSNLPLSSVSAGTLAYVESVSSLYFYSGSGWYKISVINTNPNITTGPDASYTFAKDGTPIVITLEATDPESIPITWSYSVTSGSLGNTATVSQADNVFTITPSTDENDAGEFSITFTASDGVNLATAVSSFTLAFGSADQYYNLNSLLLKSGSTAGLNNHTFVDESTNGFTLTSSGEVYQGSFSPYSPARWSAYFDGSTDYLDIPGDAAAFGTSDYTVEGWHYYTGDAATNTRFLIDCRFGGTASLLLFFESAIYKLYVNGGHVANGGTLVKDTWQHFALVRSSGSTKLYVNGTSVFTWADSTNYVSTQIRLGRDVGNNDSLSWVGYMSDIRIVKGTAVYTSNFTPPTEPLTAIPGTSLLTCQSNRFIDNSTNNLTITKYGDTKAVPFSPYLPSEQYDPAIHGGSAYFGAYPSYYSVPTTTTLSFGTDDFTVEAWVYKTDALNASIIDARAGTGTATPWGFFVDATNKPYFYQGTTYTSSIPIPLNTWAHVALTRSSGTVKIFVNGVEGFSQSITTSLNRTAGAYIGTRAGAGTDAQFKGYISEIRVVKGTAVYTSNFTPPTELLTAISGTSLLIRGANAGVYDEMGKNNVKSFGDATTSTSVTKYNTTSMYFDGNGDYLEIADDPALQLGTGDFTIEAWVYPTAWNNTTLQSIISKRSGASTYWRIGSSGSAGDLSFRHSEMTVSLQANGALTLNQWTHVAVTRINSVFYLFVDGQQAHTTSNGGTNNISYSGVPVRIGRAAPSETYYWPGYIEDVRITKGYARYTANFTPPTAPLGFNNAE